MQAQIPDDSDFLSFRAQCLGTEGWLSRYSRKGVTVWCPQEKSGGVQKVKVSQDGHHAEVRWPGGKVGEGSAG